MKRAIMVLPVLAVLLAGCDRPHSSGAKQVSVEQHATGEVRATQWPLTVDDAVADLLANLLEADMQLLRDAAKDDLVLYHHGFGTGIRNGYGLWQGNTALLDSCAERSPKFQALQQKFAGEEFIVQMPPDEASMIIIEALWEELRQMHRQGLEPRTR